MEKSATKNWNKKYVKKLDAICSTMVQQQHKNSIICSVKKIEEGCRFDKEKKRVFFFSLFNLESLRDFLTHQTIEFSCSCSTIALQISSSFFYIFLFQNFSNFQIFLKFKNENRWTE